jgi:hypothetical protein
MKKKQKQKRRKGICLLLRLLCPANEMREASLTGEKISTGVVLPLTCCSTNQNQNH